MSRYRASAKYRRCVRLIARGTILYALCKSVLLHSTACSACGTLHTDHLDRPHLFTPFSFNGAVSKRSACVVHRASVAVRKAACKNVVLCA